MVHKGRNDWWIAASLAAIAALFVARGNYWIGGPLFVLIGLCAFPQKYQTTRDGLWIQAGLTRRLIPYQAISFVGPCSGGRNLALTLEGVCVQYGLNSEVRISPADPAAFLADMAVRTPHLQRRGQELVVGVMA
jgi:hypothetical protein